MTDQVSYWLVSPAQPSGALMMVQCDRQGSVILFASPEFLGAGGYAPLEYRFDDQKMIDAKAAISDKTAALRAPAKFPSSKGYLGDAFFSELDGLNLRTMFSIPAQHLRVRLHAADDRAVDISFDLSHFKPAYDNFFSRCQSQLGASGPAMPKATKAS
jgi:hypothetical protein